MTDMMGTPPRGSGPTTGSTTGPTAGPTTGPTTGTTGPASGAGSQGGGEDRTRDVAKEEARGVAQDAAESGRATAETAKQQAGQVAGEAATQARQLVDQAREQLTSQGSAQKERATGHLRSLADELEGMAGGTGSGSSGGPAGTGGESQAQGVVGDLAREASTRIRDAADWLEHHEPGDVLAEVRRFARQRPGTFLLSAAAVGFLGGRLAKGFADEVKEYGDAVDRQSGAGGTAALGTPPPSAGTAVGTGTPPPMVGELPAEPAGTPGYAIPPTGDPDRGTGVQADRPEGGRL